MGAGRVCGCLEQVTFHRTTDTKPLLYLLFFRNGRRTHCAGDCFKNRIKRSCIAFHISKIFLSIYFQLSENEKKLQAFLPQV